MIRGKQPCNILISHITFNAYLLLKKRIKVISIQILISDSPSWESQSYQYKSGYQTHHIGNHNHINTNLDIRFFILGITIISIQIWISDFSFWKNYCKLFERETIFQYSTTHDTHNINTNIYYFCGYNINLQVLLY